MEQHFPIPNQHNHLEIKQERKNDEDKTADREERGLCMTLVEADDENEPHIV